MKKYWRPYQEVDWDRFKQYRIDTRDFYCICSNDDHTLDLSKTKKNPKRYFFDKMELMELLERLFEESGGEGGWRMLTLIGEASHRTSNWQLKYISIFRTDKGFVIYNRDEDFLFPKAMLSYPVSQKYLNHIKRE